MVELKTKVKGMKDESESDLRLGERIKKNDRESKIERHGQITEMHEWGRIWLWWSLSKNDRMFFKSWIFGKLLRCNIESDAVKFNFFERTRMFATKRILYSRKRWWKKYQKESQKESFEKHDGDISLPRIPASIAGGLYEKYFTGWYRAWYELFKRLD